MEKAIKKTISTQRIDWTQIATIILLAPFFLFPSPKYIWIFLIVPLLLISRWLINGKFFERSVFDWAIFLLTLQVLATCLIVPDLDFSLAKITGILFGILLFYSITALLKTEKLIKIGILLFLGGGLTFSVIGFLGMTTSNGKYLDSLSKISALFPKIDFNLPGAEKGFHPNAVGGTLILIVPLYLILICSFLWRKKRICLLYNNKLFTIFLFLGLLVMGSILLFTQSRGSWMAIIMSALMLLMTKKRGIKWGLLLILLFIIAYIILVGVDKIPAAFKEMKNKVASRMVLWNFAIEIIGDHPITGIGMNQIRKFPIVGHYQAQAHNHFLHTAAELGIPGLIAYLAILFGACFILLRTWQKSNTAWIRMTALGLGWGQFAYFIFGTADSISFGTKVGMFFWISLALISVLYNYVIKRKKTLETVRI